MEFVQQMLTRLPRRHRLRPSCAPPLPASPVARIAAAMEAARRALAHAQPVPERARLQFIGALEAMIRQAVHDESGDPMFQAAVLREAYEVQTYESLRSTAAQDARHIRGLVDAVAHPGKWRNVPGRQSPLWLTDLHEAAKKGAWSELQRSARTARPSELLPQLADLDALRRLVQLQQMEAAPPEVLTRYLKLREHNGLVAGSTAASAEGRRSRARGAASETRAADAFQAFADWLNAVDHMHEYRVVTSLRLPAGFISNLGRAKAEWDCVLLSRPRKRLSPDPQKLTVQPATAEYGNTPWDILVLVEAKSSVEAALSDFPVLLRGLTVLSQPRDTTLDFPCAQGSIRLNGTSLSALANLKSRLQDWRDDDMPDPLSQLPAVVYSCDAPPEPSTSPLTAASRMQLLTLPGSLKYATALMENERRPRRPPMSPPNSITASDADANNPNLIEAWIAVLNSPRYRSLLAQFPQQCRVRELIIRTDDLLEALRKAAADA